MLTILLLLSSFINEIPARYQIPVYDGSTVGDIELSDDGGDLDKSDNYFPTIFHQEFLFVPNTEQMYNMTYVCVEQRAEQVLKQEREGFDEMLEQDMI